MAVGNVAIKIDIKGAYSGQAAVTKAQRDMKGLQSSATEATVSFGKLGSTVKNALGGFLAVQGIQAAATALYDAAKAGAATNDQLAVLNAQGVNTSKILAEAGRAAGGLIPEAELARGLATYKAFGLDLEQFAATVGQSVRTAVRTGQDATYLFESLVSGIARGQSEILDNLGIILKVSDVNAEFTRTTGLSADAMTAQQKQALTLKLALEQLSGANAAVNLETGSQVAEIRRLEVAYDDLKAAIGRNLAEDISSSLRMFRTGELTKVSGQTVNWRDQLRVLNDEGPAGFIRMNREAGRAGAAFEIARASLKGMTTLSREELQVAAQTSAEFLRQNDQRIKNAQTGREILDLEIERRDKVREALQAYRDINGASGAVGQSLQFIIDGFNSAIAGAKELRREALASPVYGPTPEQAGVTLNRAGTGVARGGGGGASRGRAAFPEALREEVDALKARTDLLRQLEGLEGLQLERARLLGEEANRRLALERELERISANLRRGEIEALEANARTQAAKLKGLEAELEFKRSLRDVDRQIAEEAKAAAEDANRAANIRPDGMQADEGEKSEVDRQAEMLAMASEQLRDLEAVAMQADNALVSGLARSGQAVTKNFGVLSKFTKALGGDVDNLGKSAPGAIAAIGEIGAAAIEDTTAQAAIQAVFQLAAGVAAFASQDYAAGALHLASAAIYASIAGISASSKGGRSAGRGGSTGGVDPNQGLAREAVERGGPAGTVVYNINAPVVAGGRQAAGAALEGLIADGRSSGFREAA